MSSLPIEPLSLAVLGLGGLLHGLGELLFRQRRSEPSWRIALALAAGFALLGGLGFALDQPGFVWQGACLLAGGELTLAWLRSPLFLLLVSLGGRCLRFDLLKYSLVQGAILLLLGGILLGAQLVQIERGIEEDLSRSEFEMTQMIEPVNLSKEPALTAQSDTNRPIPLFAIESDSGQPYVENENRFLDDPLYKRKVIQTGPADLTYNCHGWVFTGGRYWLRSNRVEDILKDNQYQATAQPQPGDVAVFRNRVGEVIHTGLVRGTTDQGPLLESKWGQAGRYIHTSQEHGYPGSTLTYYHTRRGSHLLRGLESPQGSVPVTAPTTMP
jgi:hypothetical protein